VGSVILIFITFKPVIKTIKKQLEIMPIMITTRQMLYESVFSVFQSKNCELLTSEEEYALLTQTKKIPKLRYVASCGHEHSVHFNVFKSRNTGVICPVCCCKKHGEMKHLANQLHPTPMSTNHFNEERFDYENVDYERFNEILKTQKQL